jgi:dolichol-phosphate mannosyltransferase
MKEAVFSVVVPFYNEAENLPLLIGEIDTMLAMLGRPAEIILVNDGSTDAFERAAASPSYPVRWLDLSRNSGQSAAMYYGAQAAQGDYVIFLDADLQNDPADAPALFRHLQEAGLDLVTGVRVKRQDTAIRRWSSKIANAVRAFVLNDHTSDTGCSLKVLKTELAKRLPGWNGMHRFIPALAISMGYRTGEAPVNHRSRHAGVSKVIGTKRAIRATYDLIGMIWLTRRQFQGRIAESGLPKRG